MGWYTIPVVTLICWSFVSILEIGNFIEQPFDKLTQVIPVNQITSVILTDVSEIFDGIISGPEIEKIESTMLAQTLENSRSKDESYFKYYLLE